MKSTVSEFFADRARTEERTHICEHCRRAAGNAFFDDVWVCIRCRALLERQLLASEFSGGEQS